MNFLTLMYMFQNLLNGIAAGCALLLSAEFIYIVHIRKPPYPYASYAVSLVLSTIACDRFLQIISPHEPSTTFQLLAQYGTNLVLLLCALLIPLVRKGTYKRPRFQELETINEKLKYSQQLFQTWLEEAPVAAYIKDKERKVVHANSGISKLFGLDPAAVIGKTELWGDPLASQARDAQILTGAGPKEVIESLSLKDQSATILDIRFPLMGPDHALMLGGIAVDVSKQLERKNRIEVFASIVELSPDAIYSFNESGKVFTWNPAAERMFGYSREEMIGQEFTKIVAPDKRAELLITIESLRDSNKPRTDFETVFVDREGNRRAVVLAAAPVLSPEQSIDMVAVVSHDITQKKAVEEQIETLHKQLETRLAELSETNISLQKARDEAIESSSLKSAFVANISHELRTPLAGILGMSELLGRQQLDGDTNDLVSMLHESAEALLYVVNDILDLAKLEAGKTAIEAELFDIRELVSSCTSLFLPTAVGKNISLQSVVEESVPERIASDPSILRQLLLNVVANAVKFTQWGSISIHVSNQTDKEEPQIKFAVTDTGVGIDEAARKLLLTPFVRVAQSTEGGGGAGLGLAISNRLVELMQGTIGCESEEGKGSTFWFSVPVGQSGLIAAPATESEQSIPEQELAGCRVLSVDDSPVLSKLTMRQLGIIGVQADSAFTGQEAIAKATSGQFDIVLMDVNLPDMTGHDAARKIRAFEKQDRIRPITIIAMTGCTTDADRAEANQAGMDDFLEKPVSIGQLRKCLMHWLGMRTNTLI